MKLLFLDVDGALTTTMSPFQMVSSRVVHLAEVLETTGASLAISSSWRVEGIGSDSDLQRQLRAALTQVHNGEVRANRLIETIHGRTVELPDAKRQDEILEYVTRFAPTRFAAVDDWLPDFESPPPPWLCVTDPNVGLDEIARDRLIMMLG